MSSLLTRHTTNRTISKGKGVFKHVESSRKHAYIIFIPPLKPRIYIVKLGGIQGYTLLFLFLLKSIDCGYSLEPPRRGGSNKYPQSMF